MTDELGKASISFSKYRTNTIKIAGESIQVYVRGDVVTGIGDEQPLQISMYPNPAEDFVQLSGDCSCVMDYQLLRADGVAVATGQFTGATQLDVRSLPAGVYVLQITSRRSARSIKLMRR